ncbi:MAG: hypothetical protein WCG94_02515 [Methanothrix sp.]
MEDFLASTSLQDMIIRRIEIIGEAVKNLPSASFCAVQKFALHKLQVAEPWAKGKGCQHAGRDEVGIIPHIHNACIPDDLSWPGQTLLKA